MDLVNEQWALLEPYFKPDIDQKVGRPTKPARDVLNGIFWVFRTGAQWSELPSRYPPYQTCHRWYLKWQKSGLMHRVLCILRDDLRDRGKMTIVVHWHQADPSCIVLSSPFIKSARPISAGPRTWQEETLRILISPYSGECLIR